MTTACRQIAVLCLRANPAKIIGFQSHLILVGSSRLQVEVGGCRFVCSQCWFAVPDRRNQSRSKNAMIAGRGHFDCRSLQLVFLSWIQGRFYCRSKESQQ